MNKKAIYAADTAPFMIIFVLFVSVIFIVSLFLFNSHSISKVEIPEGLDSYLLSQRFLRSPECFIYEDISGRVNALTLDLSKFNQQTLNKCYQGNEKTPSFRLKLTYQDQELILQTNNWNSEQSFERAPIKNIFVQSNNKKINGKLSIEVQNV